MPTSEVIQLKDVRLSFASLDKPKKHKSDANDPNKPGKYQATFLLDPSRPDHAAQIQLVKDTAKAVFDEQWPKGAKLAGKCYAQNGDEDVYEGWENMFSVVTSEHEAPAVRSIKGAPIDPGKPGYPYSGCYVNAWISLWTQDNDFGKRVNANLIAVQFRREGEAFSGKPKVDDLDFEDLSGQNDDVPATADDVDPLGD